MSEVNRKPSKEEMELARIEREMEIEFAFTQVSKTSSKLMKVINVALRIISFGQMTAFMTSYVTTIGTTVYVPVNWWTRPPLARAALLRHERVHMRQSERMGWFFYGLHYLLFILPVGLAFGRKILEQEAYTESMWAYADYYGVAHLADTQVREKMIGHFTGSGYLWMWPFRSSAEHWYDETFGDIQQFHMTRETLSEQEG